MLSRPICCLVLRCWNDALELSPSLYELHPSIHLDPSGDPKHLELFCTSRVWVEVPHAPSATHFIELLPVKRFHINVTNVSRVIHHLYVTVTFQTLNKLLRLHGSFLWNQRVKRAVPQYSLAGSAQWAWRAAGHIKLSVKTTFCEFMTLDLRCVSPGMGPRCPLRTHSGVREGVNDSWLYTLASSAQPDVHSSSYLCAYVLHAEEKGGRTGRDESVRQCL